MMLQAFGYLKQLPLWPKFCHDAVSGMSHLVPDNVFLWLLRTMGSGVAGFVGTQYPQNLVEDD
jgi:hypothetical protein